MENVVIRLVKEKKTFKNKEGKEIEYYQYSLLFNNDCKTPIKPLFENGQATLRIMADHLKSTPKKAKVDENKKSVEIKEEDLPF